MAKKNKKEIKKVTTWKQDIKALKEAKGGKLRKGKISIDTMSKLIDGTCMLLDMKVAIAKVFEKNTFFDNRPFEKFDNLLVVIIDLMSKDISEHDSTIVNGDDTITYRVLKSKKLTSTEKATILLGYDIKKYDVEVDVIFDPNKFEITDSKPDNKMKKHIERKGIDTFHFNIRTNNIDEAKKSIDKFLSWIQKKLEPSDLDSKVILSEQVEDFKNGLNKYKKSIKGMDSSLNASGIKINATINKKYII